MRRRRQSSCATSRAIDLVLSDERGQSTVEAATLLATLMLLFGMLLQPACMLYTRMVMGHAAAQAVRVATTSCDDEVVRSFVLRRLRAVPEASVFHVGGEGDWQTSVARTSDAHRVTVEVWGHVRPLPLFGALASLAMERDAQGILLHAQVSEFVRPEWLEGSYADWVSCW